MNAVSDREVARGKLLGRHVERLALVYVRQSSPTQLERNPESTRIQYGLVETARRLGWADRRILVIDDDLGLSGASAENRAGFQRLLAEVSLDHVGLVLGAEMSRLARSNKDFHQLLELCARFGTLIADLDGLYDPSRYNDRLLLGLKGAMSEAELHILRQRLWQGKVQKASRGDLGRPVPSGYLRRASGEVVLDPDEQVRAVVRIVFEQFERIGSLHGVLRYLVEHGVRIGVRLRTGPDIGDLVWRRPQAGMIANFLKNPIYAGMYVYGRMRTDARRKVVGRGGTGRIVATQDEWLARVPDHYPAYITWEQYEANQVRIAANRTLWTERGVPRGGNALLAGLVFCGRCGHRMGVQYTARRSTPHVRYACVAAHNRFGAPRCQSLSGGRIEEQVALLALAALTPAALEISLQAAREIEAERTRLDTLWQQRLERARFDAARAERHYRSVDPENRLVARTLERAWEERLSELEALKEDYERDRARQPRSLTEAEQSKIRLLATDLPAVWKSESTTNADRQEILRLLIERIDVRAAEDGEQVAGEVHWAGGHRSAFEFQRPVQRLEQMRGHRALLDRIGYLRREGHTADEIGARLNEEGWRTPSGRNRFDGRLIRVMWTRHGLTKIPKGNRRPDGLRPDEWLLKELAADLSIPRATLAGWVRRGWVRARRLEISGARNPPWAVFMDDDERERLRRLREDTRERASEQPL